MAGIGEECNSIYMGHKPLSEEETLSLSYVLNSIAQDMMAFVNVKGFGRYITVPNGNNAISNNYDIVVSNMNTFSKHFVTSINKFMKMLLLLRKC